MTSIKAILVDDEISTLKGLEQKLNKLLPELEVVHTFQKPEEAIACINNEQPDLLFLDIEMPRINGFELLNKLEKIDFQVIFVTAYSKYAIKALKKNAIDYVLKPIDNDELLIAVEKATQVINLKQEKRTNEKLVKLLSEIISTNNKLIVPTAKGMSFIPQNEILRLEGYSGYTKIHLIDTTEIVSSYNIGKFQKMLGSDFFKCHKSHVINVKKVRAFENEGYIVLENEYRVPISRNSKKVFLDLLKQNIDQPDK